MSYEVTIIILGAIAGIVIGRIWAFFKYSDARQRVHRLNRELEATNATLDIEMEVSEALKTELKKETSDRRWAEALLKVARFENAQLGQRIHNQRQQLAGLKKLATKQSSEIHKLNMECIELYAYRDEVVRLNKEGLNASNQ